MKNYFKPDMPDGDINEISSLGLAHVGDAVFELLVRTHMCLEGRETQDGLHKAAVAMVNAGAQARYANLLMPMLTAEEGDVYRRGRNAKVNSVPKRASLGQYHSATGLEALFGWLFLKGRYERINELFACIAKQEIQEGKDAT